MDLKLDLDASDDPLSGVSWSTVSSLKDWKTNISFWLKVRM